MRPATGCWLWGAALYQGMLRFFGPQLDSPSVAEALVSDCVGVFLVAVRRRFGFGFFSEASAGAGGRGWLSVEGEATAAPAPEVLLFGFLLVRRRPVDFIFSSPDVSLTGFASWSVGLSALVSSAGFDAVFRGARRGRRRDGLFASAACVSPLSSL
jgi:hypothetical protein